MILQHQSLSIHRFDRVHSSETEELLLRFFHHLNLAERLRLQIGMPEAVRSIVLIEQLPVVQNISQSLISQLRISI